jgi:membrane-associated phospholipid phosphatase
MVNISPEIYSLIGDILIFIQIFYNTFYLNYSKKNVVVNFLTKIFLLNSFNGVIKIFSKKERPNKKNLYSFPSSHTSNTVFTTRFFFSNNTYNNNIINILTSMIIMYSRLKSNNHYLNDIIAGFAISIIFEKVTSKYFP